MSFQRAWTVIKKDLLWIKGDFKILLAVAAAPAALLLAFSSASKTGAGAKAQIGAADIPAADITALGVLMMALLSGCVAASQLILHEKTKGTLLALLTSPLKHQEFLAGKLFLSFSLSVLFSAALILTAGGAGLGLFAFLNVVWLAGAACLIGGCVGLFSETEMENNALAFAAALFFVSPFALKNLPLPAARALYSAHPLSHFFEALAGGKSLDSLLLHTGLGFLLFAAGFLFAAAYVRFYFSSGREKRFSARLALAFFCGLAGLIALSALVSGAA